MHLGDVVLHLQVDADEEVVVEGEHSELGHDTEEAGTDPLDTIMIQSEQLQLLQTREVSWLNPGDLVVIQEQFPQRRQTKECSIGQLWKDKSVE